MNKIPGARPISRSFAALAAALALTAAFAAPALADPEPTSTAPSTVEPPPSSTVPSAPPTDSSKPAAPKPAVAAQRAAVEVSLVFDKPSYKTNEDVHFTFKIKNIGETRAVGLQMAQFITDPTDLVISDWGPLTGKPGVNLERGATFSLPVTGQIRSIDKDTTVVRGFVYDETGGGVAPQFTFSAPVVKVTGHAAGVVYGDKNGNGKLEAGEQLSGVELTLRYVNGSTTYKATSDANGKIDFGDVAAAKYFLGGEVTPSWLFPFGVVQIGPDTKDLLIRGVPPLNGALKASMAFTQDTYKVGELAHVTVTLSNSGKIPLTGIVAGCNRIGDGYILNGRGPGWGDLGTDRGVTIPAGQTRTFDVSEKVPEAAFNRGIVVASCDFGYSEVDINNHAQAHDQADVPGGKAIVEGNVGVFDSQGQVKQGVAGVKVVLVSDRQCPVTGEQTTDAKGHFTFGDVAPGPSYRLYFLPPTGWRIENENPMEITVFGPPENHRAWRIDAVTGDAPLPTVPAQPADCGKTTPPPTTTPGTGGGEGSGSGLASTGADVMGLGALALVALGLGAGLVLGARRRRRLAD